MGHDIVMEWCSFRSSLSIEEINKRWQAYCKRMEIDVDEYSFITENDEVNVVPYSEEYYARHGCRQELAEFITTVIGLKEHTTLTFEDGDETERTLIFHSTAFHIANKDLQMFDVEMRPYIKGIPKDAYVAKHIKENWPDDKDPN